jgi:hypothetical protein
MSKKRIANYVFLPGVASSSNAFPNAYNLINSNQTFITNEATAYIAAQVATNSALSVYPNAVNLLKNNANYIAAELSAWITAQVSGNAGVFNGYSYGATQIAKCIRDVGYTITALTQDVQWGGNENITTVAKQYYLSGVVQVINIPVEQACQTQLYNIIINYILPKVAYTSLQSTYSQYTTGSAAEAGAVTQVTSLKNIVSNVIGGGLSTLPAVSYPTYPFTNYVYDQAKCQRDIGFVLGAYLNDLRYGGNYQTSQIASKYWYNGASQITGDRRAEVYTHQFIAGLIENVIFQGDYTAKCQRDIGYLLDGIRWDVALGTNYNQIFLGLAELNSLSISAFVISTLQSTQADVLALPAVQADPVAISRVNGFFNQVIAIAQNGRGAASAVSFTNPTTATVSQIAAKDQLQANAAFIAAEVNAWVALNYPTLGDDTSKCARDIGYAVNAMSYDILYGCNQATYDQAKFFFYGFASGVDGIATAHQAATVAAYNYFASIVDNIVMGQTITKTTTGSNPNTLTQSTSGNVATQGDANICTALGQITAGVIGSASQSAALTYLSTITKTYPSITWASSTLQAAKASFEANKSAIIALVVYTPYQTSYPRQVVGGIVAEAGASTVITTLSGILTSVVTNGITSLPALVNGVTTVKLQGRYKLDTILLITNTTHNQILYNFADNTQGATVSYASTTFTNGQHTDIDFPQYYETADYVTTITFNVNTATYSSTDDVQIFVEDAIIRTRPWDFGTDAIERQRVATPQSMIDADFEYGLQPTKWQALGIARGYPSVYELPGTDISVVSVATDASTGTGGVGASLITVTCAVSHGLTAGQPITISAFANSIAGFSRAEGTFTVNSIISLSVFTYYATSLVGVNNGDILSTNYTQLRKAAFYTGASIGTPSFSVYSNGSAGTFTTALITTAGTGQLAFNGTVPNSGTPISGTGIASGTQITGTVGTGGIVVTATQATTNAIGDNIINVVDSTGIVPGLGVDNGSGIATFVDSVNGNAVTLTTQLTTVRPGTTQTYLNVSAAETTPGGTGAVFSVTRTNNTYASASATTAGSGYTAGKQIRILGTVLSGTSPANDLILTINSTDGNGGITALVIAQGSSVNGEQSFTAVSQASTSGTGSGALFDISTLVGAYNVTVETGLGEGTNYAINDTITILGTRLGGATPANDLTITVQSIFGGGMINTISVTGTAVNSNTTFTTLSGSVLIGTGTGATFDVTRASSVYTVVLNQAGTNYTVGDNLIILGTALGGATPANDLLLSVTGASGGVTLVNTSGTATGGATLAFYSSITTNLVTSATVPANTTITASAISKIQITFSSNHGLVPGSSMLITISSTGTNHNLAQGPFYVEQVPSLTTIIYTARAAGAISTSASLIGSVYARPNSFFTHRPFDGGVQLGTGGPQHSAQAIRMSKKYIRYQSGKGINFNTGALFAPSYDIQSMSATGTAIGSYVTVTTDDSDHGCQAGGTIKIVGVDTPGYNGTYVVDSVVSERVFIFRNTTVLSNSVATITTTAQMTVLTWHGATVRSGTYDDQNGMFWQYDGQIFSVVKRSSTFKLAGTVNIAANTNTVTGTNTRFRDQIKAGDRITIKGMTHLVSNVISQTQMSVNPDYRGNSDCISGKACLIQDTVIPQSQFNMDRLDGTGPSGYNLDIGKMQMIGMQWTWYGAGFIDYMLRGSDGNYVFAHRIRNSNVNTEAYMRTGNMPVRYEVLNESASSRLANSITATATTIPLQDATYFPNSSGIVYIDNEMITFNGKSGNNLIGCSRSSPMINFSSGALRTFTAGNAAVHEINTGVVLISNTISPPVSHWGSAFIEDGRFDEDRGYLFNYASVGIPVSTTPATAFLIRLAPSVSNAIIGDLGDRELINRAQFLLKGIETTSDSGTGGIIIQGVLNPSNYPTDPGSVAWSGLSSTAASGQPSFAQVAPGGSVNWAGGGSTTTGTATTISAPTGTASGVSSALYNQAIGSQTVYVTAASWTALNATAGYALSTAETKFPSGTTIGSVTAAPSPIATTLSTVTGSVTIPPSAYFKTPAGSNTLYILQSSWQTIGGSIGLAVSSSDFPAGTVVSNVTGPASAAGQNYYTVTFNNNATSPHNPVATQVTITAITYSSPTVTFTFAAQSYTPYQNGDSITISGLTGTAAGYNGTYSVVTCTTTTVQVNQASNFGTTVAGTPRIINNNTNNSVQLSVGGTAAVNTTTLYFTQASWANLPIGAGQVGNTTNDTGKFSVGTTINTISSVQTFNTVSYYTVTFSTNLLNAVPAASTVTLNYTPYYTLVMSKGSTTAVQYATASAGQINGTIFTTGGTQSGVWAVGDLLTGTGVTAATSITAINTAVFVGSISGTTLTVTSVTSGTIAIGMVITGGSIATTGIYIVSGSSLSWVINTAQTQTSTTITGTSYTVNNSQTASPTPISGTPTIAITPAIVAATSSFQYFSQTTWELLVATYGATVGTTTTSTTYFPSGTSISAISSLLTFGGTNYYKINFSQSSITSVPSSTAITFQFGLPPYAQPGETVFSFIAAPGTTVDLDLSNLKELTNTTLGGRGCYPNGPDVLAINLYRASGTGTINTNLVIRWAEAQA